MLRVGFEPTTLAFKWEKTLQTASDFASDCEATLIGI
jgi:hypothetical protein